MRKIKGNKGLESRVNERKLVWRSRQSKRK